MKQNDHKQNDDLIIKGKPKKREREWNKSKQTGVTRVTTIVNEIVSKSRVLCLSYTKHYILGTSLSATILYFCSRDHFCSME
jgi:adenine-specific DNA methylase